MAYLGKRFVLFSILFGILGGFLFFGSTEIEGDGQSISGKATGKKGEIVIGQTFFSGYENLTRIDVMFSNVVPGSHAVTFGLKELPSSLELCEPVQQQIKTGFRIYALYQTGRIGQTFTASCPDLEAIQVLISTRRLSDKGKILFRLKSTPAAEDDLVEIAKELSDIKSHEYQTFEFRPILDSQSKKYYFFLEIISPETPEKGFDSQNDSLQVIFAPILTIPYTPDETYQEGRGYLDDMPITGDLLFKTQYRRPLGEEKTLLRIQTHIPNVRSQYRTFRFSPIQESKGKVYYFFFEMSGSMLVPWEVESDLYQQGTKVMDHSPVAGDLTFKTFYKTSRIEAFRVLLGRIVEDRPLMLSRQIFYILVFFAYLLVCTIFLWQLFSSSQDETPR